MLPEAKRERYKNAGAQSAREPVTKATAVKPSDDNTKLRLPGKERKEGWVVGITAHVSLNSLPPNPLPNSGNIWSRFTHACSLAEGCNINA